MSTTAQLVLVTPEPRRRSAVPEQVVNVNVVPDERMLLTVVEAARRLGIGRSSMYRLLDAGQIRSIHVGRSHRIPVDALVEFVNQQQGTPPASVPKLGWVDARHAPILQTSDAEPNPGCFIPVDG